MIHEQFSQEIAQHAQLTKAAYYINSTLSKIELHAAAFHSGAFTLFRSDTGQYSGYYGSEPLDENLFKGFLTYDKLSDLAVMMAEIPEYFGVNGPPAGFL